MNRAGSFFRAALCASLLFVSGLHNAMAQLSDSSASPQLLAELAATNFTPEEQRNVDRLLEYMKTDRISPEVLREYYVENPVFHRMGAVELPKLTGADYSGEGIPDRSDTIVDLVAKGDRVAMIFHIKGTHTGTFFGVPPTDNPIDIFEVAFLRFEEGKIAESWWALDELGLISQMGVASPLDAQ